MSPEAALAPHFPASSSRLSPPQTLDPRAILTSIGEVVYDWNLASDAIVWGLNAGDVFGLQDTDALNTGRRFAEAVEPGSGRTRSDAIFCATDTDAGSGVPYRTRYALRIGERTVAVEDTGRWYADTEGRAAFAHGVLRVDRHAGEDGVFGPGSRERSSFLAHIAGDVAETARTKRSITLLTAAIEHLAVLNDELGYESADLVIREVMLRMRQVMRRRDRFMRYSGNRFALALMSCPTDQAHLAAERLARAVDREPIRTPAGSVLVRLRIGAASAPEHAVDAAGLLLRAEDALRVARLPFGHHYAVYDPDRRREELRLRGTPPLDIVEALNAGRITFARQPVVHAGTRETVFCEALLRLASPCGRVIPAGDILPAVERAGLVPLLDARILDLATDYLVAHPWEQLAINTSPLTLESPTWVTTLASRLNAKPGVAARLIVEVTETVAVGDPLATRKRLDAIRNLGVRIALDDFGAGHTSFRHLRDFPIDFVKIDGAFVQNLSRSPDDRFFVRTLVDLARHLGVATVAEWVEDEEAAEMLIAWGVDYLQGEHCGAPALVAPQPRLALALSA